mmetsp:Transcript_19218/g.38647  ORF Transcript_19218/g.38647 Transcript_19218/m.38647 type:complete len:201 (-) Transcript_19218:3707-4309(-)
MLLYKPPELPPQCSALLPHHPNSLQHSPAVGQTPLPLFPPPQVPADPPPPPPLLPSPPDRGGRLKSARKACLLAAIRSGMLWAGSQVAPGIQPGQPVSPGSGHPRFTMPLAYLKRVSHSARSGFSVHPASMKSSTHPLYPSNFSTSVTQKKIPAIHFKSEGPSQMDCGLLQKSIFEDKAVAPPPAPMFLFSFPKLQRPVV